MDMQMRYEAALETYLLMWVGEYVFGISYIQHQTVIFKGEGVVLERPNGINFYINGSNLNG